MKEQCVPLDMITLFQPEIWMRMPGYKLRTIPYVKRNRQALEQATANQPGIQEEFRGRNIKSHGDRNDHLRNTRLKTKDLAEILSYFQVQLINTDGEHQQSEWKLEWRVKWNEDEKVPMEESYKETIMERLIEAKNLSIRQLWLNPLPNAGLEKVSYAASRDTLVGNLMLGVVGNGANRDSDVRFSLNKRVWIHFPLMESERV